MLVVGTDSHTTTHGALGAASTGIGTSEMAYALATGTLWFRVPETIRFDLEGAPDEVTADYLANLEHSAGVQGWQRRYEEHLMEADPDASYLAVHKVPLSEIGPQVALPHEVDHVVPVGQAVGTVIQQAFIGSCTNGRLEDLEAAAAVLKGRTVHPEVRLIVAPASRWIFQEALRRGIIHSLAALRA